MIHDTVSKIAEPWSLFYNSAKNLQFFFFLKCGHQNLVPAVSPCWAWRWVGGSDSPWLVCEMEGLLLFLFCLECSPRVGWAQNTLTFPHCSAVSSAAPSLLCREKSAEVWVEEDNGEKYSTGTGCVGCAEKWCAEWQICETQYSTN